MSFYKVEGAHGIGFPYGFSAWVEIMVLDGWLEFQGWILCITLGVDLGADLGAIIDLLYVIGQLDYLSQTGQTKLTW